MAYFAQIFSKVALFALNNFFNKYINTSRVKIPLSKICVYFLLQGVSC